MGQAVVATPIVENAWVLGRSLQIHGWIYGMADGLLRDLGPTLSSLANLGRRSGGVRGFATMMPG